VDDQDARDAPPPSGLSTLLLVFGGIDIVLAFLLLVGGGFSWQFWGITLIGLALVVWGFKERIAPSTRS